VFFIAGTQHTQAQTKEETIDWLNTHANSLMKKDYRCMLIKKISSDGEIVMITSRYHENEYFIRKHNLKNDIWLEDIWLGSSGTIASGTKEYSVNFSPKEPFLSESIGEYGRWNSCFCFTDEQNAKRVYNALIHLAKLLGTKSKPKENTF